MKIAAVLSIFALSGVRAMDLGDDGKSNSMQSIDYQVEELQESGESTLNDLAQTLVSVAGPRSTEWSHEVFIQMENLSEKDV